MGFVGEISKMNVTIVTYYVRKTKETNINLI